jgi:splicing factor 3A subunit 1
VQLTLTISTPSQDNDKGWTLNGQPLTLSVRLDSSVDHLKQTVERLLHLPVKLQKLKCGSRGVLKDVKTLAYYNLTDGDTLELAVQQRGGKR